MATIDGHDHRTLKQKMFQQYGDFNAFQLMRLLLGQFATTLPIEQRLRFKADLSSAFPAREFSRLSVRDDAKANTDIENVEDIIEISSANFCIASVLGPMPESFTEWVRDLVAERIPAMADFLDIFNQRINILRFELKQAQTLALNSLAPGKTRVAQDLAALMGLGTAQLAEQVPLPPRAWLGLAGLLANRRKNAATVVHVLNLVLQAKVTLTPFVGSWQNIEAQDTTKLGARNQRLGQSSVLGQRVWDQHSRIRLEIETLDYHSACQLLPPNQLECVALANNPSLPTSNFSRFAALLLLLLDGLVDCEVVIQVADSSIPPAQLMQPRAADNELSAAMRLGQTAWLPRRVSTNAAPRVVRYLLCANDCMRAA